jgi:hypothetical protein
VELSYRYLAVALKLDSSPSPLLREWITWGRMTYVLSSKLELMSTSTATPQQINVADLQLPQLAEVKRQLEEVGPLSALDFRL